MPGASYGSGEGNRDQIVLRGNSSTADFFVDGVRDDVQYFRDFYNVERVEVLKGPNAMIFGRGGGGGIVNRVLKRPSFTAARSIIASGDGWGGRRFAADLDQPLSGLVALRLNGLFENSDSFRRHVDLKRYGINPTVALRARPRHADRPVIRIFSRPPNRRPRRPRATATSRSGASPEPSSAIRDLSYSKADVNLATLAVEHDFGKGLTLKEPDDVRRL